MSDGSRKTGGGGQSLASPTFEVIEDADSFREAAIFVFGNYGWLRQLANAFGKDESTIHRWVNEQSKLPYYARSALAAWKIVFEKTGMRPPEQPEMRARQAERSRKAAEARKKSGKA